MFKKIDDVFIVKILCVVSILMNIFYYYGLSYYSIIYDENSMGFLSETFSTNLFFLPNWFYHGLFFIGLVVYFFIYYGFNIFRHFLFLLIFIGILLNFSSSLIVVTSLDRVFMNILCLSDGALLYVLYRK